MALSLINLISGAGLLFAMSLTPALSATVVNGGVIHFRGSIVEDPCEMTPLQQHISLTCPQKGKLKTTQISYQDALRGRNPFPDVATVNMKYINPEKSLAVVQIDYR